MNEEVKLNVWLGCKAYILLLNSTEDCPFPYGIWHFPYPSLFNFFLKKWMVLNIQTLKTGIVQLHSLFSRMGTPLPSIGLFQGENFPLVILLKLGLWTRQTGQLSPEGGSGVSDRGSHNSLCKNRFVARTCITGVHMLWRCCQEHCIVTSTVT